MARQIIAWPGAADAVEHRHPHQLGSVPISSARPSGFAPVADGHLPSGRGRGVIGALEGYASYYHSFGGIQIGRWDLRLHPSWNEFIYSLFRLIRCRSKMFGWRGDGFDTSIHHCARRVPLCRDGRAVQSNKVRDEAAVIDAHLISATSRRSPMSPRAQAEMGPDDRHMEIRHAMASRIAIQRLFARPGSRSPAVVDAADPRSSSAKPRQLGRSVIAARASSRRCCDARRTDCLSARHHRDLRHHDQVEDSWHRVVISDFAARRRLPTEPH